MFTLPFSQETKRLFFAGPEAETARQIIASMDSEQKLKNTHDDAMDQKPDERFDDQDKQEVSNRLNRIQAVLQPEAGSKQDELLNKLREEVNGLTEQLERSQSFFELLRSLGSAFDEIKENTKEYVVQPGDTLDSLAQSMGMNQEVLAEELVRVNQFQALRSGVDMVVPMAAVEENAFQTQKNFFDNWRLMKGDANSVDEYRERYAEKIGLYDRQMVEMQFTKTTITNNAPADAEYPGDYDREKKETFTYNNQIHDYFSVFLMANADRVSQVFDFSKLLEPGKTIKMPQYTAEQANQMNQNYQRDAAERVHKQMMYQMDLVQRTGTKMPEYLEDYINPRKQSLEGLLKKLGIEGKVVIGSQGMGIEMKKNIAGKDQSFTLGVRSDFDPRNPEDLQRISGILSYSKEVVEKTVVSINAVIGADQQVVAANISRGIQEGALEGSTIRAGVRVININKLSNDQIPNGLSRDDISQVRIYEGMAEFETKSGDIIGITLSSAEVDARGNNIEGGKAGMVMVRGKKQLGEYGSVELNVSKTQETLSGKIIWANRGGDVRITLGAGQEIGFNSDYSKRKDARGSLGVEVDVSPSMTLGAEAIVGFQGDKADLGGKLTATYHVGAEVPQKETTEAAVASGRRYTPDEYERVLRGESVEVSQNGTSSFLEREARKSQESTVVDNDQVRRIVGEAAEKKPRTTVSTPEVVPALSIANIPNPNSVAPTETKTFDITINNLGANYATDAAVIAAFNINTVTDNGAVNISLQSVNRAGNTVRVSYTHQTNDQTDQYTFSIGGVTSNTVNISATAF